MTRDVTQSQQDELERTQLRLERNQLAQALTVDQISTSLAHEINQPLGAILNNAEAARSLLSQGPGRPEVLPEILEDIIADALRAGEIIRKVRKVLRKGEARFEPLSVNGLIEESLEILKNNLALNDVELRLDLSPDLPEVEGDRVRLQQVILNLVKNALDAMTDVPPRRLTIRTSKDRPDKVTVSVGDSGPGIRPDVMEKVFQPFFTTKKSGLGLGLSICRSIIEEHRGRAWCENVPGRGAVFSFSLTARPEGHRTKVQ
jgi:C4-dicarboxylate-specific signal transduction histidine kinase